MKKVRNRGFSLIELIFVLVILAILVTIVVATYPGLMHNMRLKADRSSAQGIARALRVGYIDYKSDDILNSELRKFIEESNVNNVTVPISEFGLFDRYISVNTKPVSRVDISDIPLDNQKFSIGFLEIEDKIRILVYVGTGEELDLSTLDASAEADTIATYDGYEDGIVYIEPKQ